MNHAGVVNRCKLCILPLNFLSLFLDMCLCVPKVAENCQLYVLDL